MRQWAGEENEKYNNRVRSNEKGCNKQAGDERENGAGE